MKNSYNYFNLLINTLYKKRQPVTLKNIRGSKKVELLQVTKLKLL